MTYREFLYMEEAARHKACLKEAQDCTHWIWFHGVQSLGFSGFAFFGEPSVVTGVLIAVSAGGFFVFRHLRKIWELRAKLHSTAMEALGKPQIVD